MNTNCRTELLSEYLDQELDAAAQTELEQHLSSCPSCAGLLGELRNVTRHAGALVDRTPSHDLWPGIATRIGASPIPVAHAKPNVVFLRRRVSFSVPQLLAAGLAVLTIGGTGSIIALRSLDVNAAAPLVTETTEVSSGGSFAVIAVETQYDQAISELTAILQRDRDRLNPRTVRALEANLAVIDGAIQRARQALLQDPQSDYLRDHLDRTVRQKLDLLRRANTIVSRS